MTIPSDGQSHWPSDYRKFDRFSIEGEVDVTTAQGEKFRGWCLDVAEGGLGATISTQLEIGQPVVVNFQLPTARARLNLEAVVRYAKGFWYGLEFVALDAQHRDVIREYGKSVKAKTP